MEKFTATCLLLAVVFILSVSANNGITNEPELANEIAQKEEIIESIPEVDAQPEQEVVLEEVPIVADTLPKKFQGDGNFVYAKDDEKVELKYEDGEIVKMKINGTKIYKEEFEYYMPWVNELLEELPIAPTPPMPPSVWEENGEEEEFADEEGMDIFTNGRKSIVTHDEDGNKVIILENKNGSETKITLKNGIMKFDGEDIDLDNLPDDFDKISLFGDAIIRNDDINLSTDDLAFVMPEMAEIPEFPEIDFVMPEMPAFPEMPEMEFENFNFDTIPFGNDDWSNFYSNKNLTEEEKKEVREAMKEAREEFKEAMKEYKANHKEAMKEYQEQMKETRKEQQEAIREMRESMREAREEAIQNQRESIQDARELAQEARERSREAREEGLALAQEYRNQARRKNNVWKKSFEQQMRQDGFIDSDGDYDFKMKHNNLKINGQKQSSAMLDKYIQLYEQSTGKSLGDRFSIKISNDGSNSTTSISIDN